MNTLSITDPLPRGPEHFDAEAFAAHTLSSPHNLAAVLDHTLLKPDATRTQVLQLCNEAAQHRFACVMINPTWVSLAAAALQGTGIPVGVVIGFPSAPPSPSPSAKRPRTCSNTVPTTSTWSSTSAS
ncbi:hypothetical protein [Tunturiibacter gelidiferens]|uniref:hypothetical protein n=1 Tax=Tunturiibacter gelidiferens TaxID=3069689 RepID=UPI003D9BA90C